MNKTTSIKPHLDRWRTQLASIEADARLSAADKAAIFSTLEGLVSMPRLRWQELADKEKASEG